MKQINEKEYKKVNGTKTLPTVSVIVPTYRRDNTLKRALKSLDNQTYEFTEVIVVDDNANKVWNEKVENIVNHFIEKKNKKYIYIKNKTNEGSAKTRNKGIEASTGEYITFLDDDDIYLTNKIKNQVEHMIKANSDYSITDLALYNEEDKLIEVRRRKYIKEKNKQSLIRYHLKYHLTGTDTMMFKAEYLSEIGGFPPINVGDEFYLMMRAIEGNGKFSYLPVMDNRAYIHTITDGLSSGESKIKGENALFEYKKNFFNQLNRNEISYIKMRHFAVLAFADLRMKKYKRFLLNSLKSFISSPINCIKLIFQRFR